MSLLQTKNESLSADCSLYCLNRFRLGIGLAAIVTLTTTVALGDPGVATKKARKEFYRPVPAKPLDRSHWGRSSTPIEGLLRGLALGIQATGNFLYNTSQAAILQQHARSLAFDNRNRLSEFYDNLKARREARKAVKRQANEKKNPQVFRKAYELSSDELNRETGQIVWPDTLLSDEYAGHRSRIEQLYRDWSGYGETIADPSRDIQHHTESLIAKLRTHRSEVLKSKIELNNYLVAQNFLRGLKYEARFAQAK